MSQADDESRRTSSEDGRSSSSHAERPMPSVSIHWTRANVVGPSPPPRSFSTLNAFDEGQKMALLGGRNESAVFADFWILSLSHSTHEPSFWTKMQLSPRIVGRAYHVAVVRHDKELIVHGGRSLSVGPIEYYSDMYSIDLSSGAVNRVRQVNGCGGRAYHSAVLREDANDCLLVCFGGHNERCWFDVLSIFSLTTNMWRHIQTTIVDRGLKRHCCECTLNYNGLDRCESEYCNEELCFVPSVHKSGVASAWHTHFFSALHFEVATVGIESSYCHVDEPRPLCGFAPRDAHSCLLFPSRHSRCCEGTFNSETEFELEIFGGELCRTFFNTHIRLCMQRVANEDSRLVGAEQDSMLTFYRRSASGDPPIDKFRVELREYPSTTEVDCREAHANEFVPGLEQRRSTPCAGEHCLSPCPRAYHGAWSALDSYSIIMGGYQHRQSTFLGNCFAFHRHREQWIQVQQHGDVPPPLASFGLTPLDQTGTKVVFFGGDSITAGYRNEVFLGHLVVEQTLQEDVATWLALGPKRDGGYFSQ